MAHKRHSQSKRSRAVAPILAGLAFSGLALPGGLLAQAPVNPTIDGTANPDSVYNQTNPSTITTGYGTNTIATGPNKLGDYIANKFASGTSVIEAMATHLIANPTPYDGTGATEGGFVGFKAADTAGQAVTIKNINYAAGGSNSTENAFVVAPGLIFGSIGGLGEDAEARSVTIDSISFSAATATENPAAVFDFMAGVLSVTGDAEADSITISNVKHTAESNNTTTYGSSFATGIIAGVGTLGSGKDAWASGAVSITGVEFSATTKKAIDGFGNGYGAFSGGLVTGVSALNGYAGALGPVTIEAKATSTVDSGTGVSAAILSAYGVQALNKAGIAGDISVKAITSASGGNSDTRVNFGQAVGITARDQVFVGGQGININVKPKINVEGSTYAFAIASTPNQSATGLETNILVPGAVLRAKADSLVNNYNPFNNPSLTNWAANIENLLGTTVPYMPMPVAEAEFLGLTTTSGSPDTVNFHFDGLMDNNEKALRIFGAEVVNIGDGLDVTPELKLFGGSYFINQKAFDHDLANYGVVLSPSTPGLATDVNVHDGATLHIAGMIKHDLTQADGAHQDLFSTKAGGVAGFRLGDDYTLNLNTEAGSTLKFSQLKETDGRKAAWDSGNNADVATSEAMFRVTHAVDSLSTINAIEADLTVGEIINVQAMAPSTVTTPDKTIKVLAVAHDGSNDISLRGDHSGSKLFYDYNYRIGTGGGDADGHVLFLDIDRNDTALSSVTRYFGASPNADRLANAMAAYRITGTDGTDASPYAYNSEFDRWITRLANLENTETDAAYFADQLNRAHGEMHATTVLSLQQYFKSFFNQFQVQSPNLPESWTLYPAYGDESAPSAGGYYNTWTARASVFGNWGRLDQDGRYFGADTDSVAGLISVENAINEEVILGIGFGAGTSEVKFDKYGAKSESDDLALAVYGQYRPATASDFFLYGRLGYGQSSVDTRRRTPFNATAKASYDVDYFNAALTGGYDFRFDNGIILTPSLTLSYLSTNPDDATEKGGGIHNLRLNNQDMDSFEAIANLEVKKIIPTSSGHVKLRANVGVAQEFMDTNTALTTTFVSAPTFPRWRNESPDIGNTRFLVGAGVEAKVSENAAFALDYQGSFQSNYDNHAAQATFKYSW